MGDAWHIVKLKVQVKFSNAPVCLLTIREGHWKSLKVSKGQGKIGEVVKKIWILENSFLIKTLDFEVNN